jgi:hypothetical protein
LSLLCFGGFDDPVDAGLGQAELRGNAAEAVSGCV